jgi:ferredoxin
MDIQKTYAVYFSPTGTTEKAVIAVAEGTGLPTEKLDLTSLKSRVGFSRSFSKKDLVVVGMPVYGGRLPMYLDNFFYGLNGKGAPAIALVMYGNREYEDALIELKIRLEERGFKVIAGAVFIGEHTYSKNIATGRPNAADLKIAQEFGTQVIKGIDKAIASTLTVKGNYPYIAKGSKPTEGGPIFTVALIATTDDCTLCGLCAEECPWGAITMGDKVTTDYTKCLRCLRCIKICPVTARVIPNPKYNEYANKFAEWLKDRRREPELFLAE